MKKPLLLSVIIILLLVTGCATVRQLLNNPGSGKGPVELDEATIVAGLKEALSVGTKAAVRLVSAKDGYLANAAIRIPVPEDLKDVEKRLRQIGLGDQVDEFVLNMNQAAEKAAVDAADIFLDAVKQMTLDEARKILNGADNAATRYFEEKTRGKLYTTFHPTIKNAMDRVGVNKIFRFLIDSYNKIPLIKKVDFKIGEYVNNKALDGLFYMLAGEEKKIRRDPAARVTELLKKVFG